MQTIVCQEHEPFSNGSRRILCQEARAQGFSRLPFFRLDSVHCCALLYLCLLPIYAQSPSEHALPCVVAYAWLCLLLGPVEHMARDRIITYSAAGMYVEWDDFLLLLALSKIQMLVLCSYWLSLLYFQSLEGTGLLAHSLV